MPDRKEVRVFFIDKGDAFAADINAKAYELYCQLKNLDISRLDTAARYKDYFAKHHLGKRLFFSMQNSAHIIYYAVLKTQRPASDLSFIDYGAGLGTLFMLAGKLGFKRTMYNDYFPEWHQPARALCSLLGIQIDDYVEGDIDAVTKYAEKQNMQLDIIASRNVLEHIYSLPHFYGCIQQHNSNAVVYSTTTANYHNPVMRWYHVYVHNKWEKLFYRKQRLDEIKKLQPSIAATQLEELADITRGKAGKNFTDAIHDYMAGKPVVPDKTLRSNSCDCITGVWNEHLLKKTDYAHIIGGAGFKMDYTPGFWDTHYHFAFFNFATRLFNKLIMGLKNRGILLSPFVNVTAYN
jgi:2-polyprenyl-3-methyl-5-hydroxy-6-metoxy-1,4-benzoquinol methylase